MSRGRLGESNTLGGPASGIIFVPKYVIVGLRFKRYALYVLLIIHSNKTLTCFGRQRQQLGVRLSIYRITAWCMYNNEVHLRNQRLMKYIKVGYY
jgi:hypothetical protein